MRTKVKGMVALVALGYFAASYAIAAEGEPNDNQAADCAPTSLKLTPEECDAYDQCLSGAGMPGSPIPPGTSPTILQCDAALRFRRRHPEPDTVWLKELPVRPGTSLSDHPSYQEPLPVQEVDLVKQYDVRTVAGKAWIAGNARLLVSNTRNQAYNWPGQRVEITIDSANDPVLKGCEKVLNTALPASEDKEPDHQMVIKGLGRETAVAQGPRGLWVEIIEFKSLMKCELAPIEKPQIGMDAPAKSR